MANRHLSPYDFERSIAAMYRTMGAEVQHDVSIAGSQIDVLVVEKSSSGATVRRAVECKAFQRPVGVDIIRAFAALYDLLRQRGLVDAATVVAANGFSSQAREAGKAFNIELLETADLMQRSKLSEASLLEASSEFQKDETSARSRSVVERPNAFAIMPFSDEFTDVYLLAIREAAERCGITVERADESVSNGLIIDYIWKKIAESDLIIADTSHPNPNVYYEVGYAHGLGKSVILTSRATNDLPFDVSGFNHILYSSIHALREELTIRIGAALSGP